MNGQDLKKSILQLAIQGKLVEQREEEGTAKELLEHIEVEKEKLIKDGKIKKQKKLPEISEDEIPFDIPESWEWDRLGNVLQIINGDRGKNYPSKDKLINKGIPFISALNIENQSISEEKLLYMNEEQYEKLGSGKLILGDLVLCIRGSLGKNGRYPFERGAIASSLVILRSYMQEETYYSFITKYLNSGLFNNEVLKYNNGTAQPNLGARDLAKFLIPVPPLEEQKRIVAKIEELMPYVEKYNKAYSEVEELNKKFPEDMQKSILQYAIQGKLVEQREEEGTAEELYQRIQEEKTRLVKEGKIKKEKQLAPILEEKIRFDIPESWKWVSIGQVCSNITYGTSKKSSKEGKIAVLRMGNLQGGIIDYSKLVYSSDDEDIKKYKVEKNDLLFNRTNSRELVGKTAIYKSELPAIYAGYLVRITPVLVCSDYINFVMQSNYYWRYCQSVRSDAIGQSNINAEKLKSFVFPLPPLEEQKRIVEKIEELLPFTKQLVK
ncbi:restriction endonuclease subunit S [Marinicrinis sediminis]|uniref:Restriction endonuclease subunit S n=1 Tax=Marinicrinis sediminis TaxID=1652465 RepID=A0ABW5RA43_9BACL